MTTRFWPDTLPGLSNAGFEMEPADQVRRTQMEVGTRRVRRISAARQDEHRVSWILTDREMAAFRAWYGDEAWSLLGASDSLSGWGSLGATVGTDSAVGPLVAFADRIVEGNDDTQHRVRRDFDPGFVAGGSVVVSVTLKAAGRTKARIAIGNTDDLTCTAQVDLGIGAFGTLSNIDSATILDRGSGWYRVTLVAATGAGTALGSMTPYCQINLVQAFGDLDYDGDGASGVDVCEINARMQDTFDLYLPTDADGHVLGAAGGSAWFLLDLPRGGGLTRVESRFAGPFKATLRKGLHWAVSAPLETRYA